MNGCDHRFATKLVSNMIVIVYDVIQRTTRNISSHNVYIPNVEYYQKPFKYADGKVGNGASNNIQIFLFFYNLSFETFT